MRTKVACLLFLCLFAGTLNSFSQLNIIPLPQTVKANGTVFIIKPQTNIYYQKGLKAQAELLASALSPATGYDFKLLEAQSAKDGIWLTLGKTAAANPEAYRLTVGANQVSIVGNTSKGVFYGIQTLLQLLPAEIYNPQRQKGKTWTVKGADIQDAPLYPWRGMMLDVSRYFFSKAYVLRFIDIMAMYKMNMLHFHLIDDAGWRLEIKKYPKLTSMGAWRGKGAERTGGYYTQEDIKEIVAYASARNVEVIPEIELPAHTLAAVVAYPYLGCTGQQFEMPTQHSISKELYCVGKETTFDFLADVFKEVFALFPSKYVHIGGDEAVYTRWAACPYCQKRKTDLGLKTEAALQVYFNQRVQNMVKPYGKTIVGWDEIIEDGLKEKVVGMVWHDPKKTFKAVENGHDVVMSLTKFCYFDMAESNIPGEVKAATWVGLVPLEKVYQLNPLVPGLDEKYRKQVLGASATLWADQFIHGTILQEIGPLNENRSEKYFDYLTFPRLSALAEVVWTPLAQQNWEDFEKRLASHYLRYQNAGYGFRLPQPKLISAEKTDKGYLVKLKNVVDGAQIRYTTDGTYPNPYSPVYNQSVTVGELKDLMAITVLNREQFSLPLYFPEKYEQFKKYGEVVAEWNPNKIKGKDFGTFEINATGKINANGNYALTFMYTGGSTKLEIQSITVWKNGVKIAEDIHEGSTGSAQKDNVYKFNIKEYETGASFIIKAMVRGDVDNDSNGIALLKKEG
ncbi:family 20 glycosylhydrolase [Pedobacter sp. KR3-3]|uniref:beta-N-acetylhexosaminidase n=1 Tax=Pedobacter albus TaxID=3113905 RepID=A0ABU7I9T8_9SPHI|nr:family 20 glycosylhydrolase [Pedobacter sp. KR3-3]MEE1946243.1 family 20 glycosylhydrolase [Pedobacter sp. KR3-3]